MLRFLSRLVRTFRTANTTRTPRRAQRRSMLRLEGLEDRMLLSAAGATPSFIDRPVFRPSAVVMLPPPATVSLNPATHTLTVTVDQPGEEIIITGTKTAGDLAVSLAKSTAPNKSTLLGVFTKAEVKSVVVNLASSDILDVDDSHGGLPFNANTTVSISGSASSNSVDFTGTVTIKGFETYVAGDGSADGKLTLQGTTAQVGTTTYTFDSTITSITDSLKITGFLDVQTSSTNVSLSNTNGAGQELTGLGINGGAVHNLTFSNKPNVILDMFGSNATVTLDATAAAAAEQSFAVNLNNEGAGQLVNIDGTPSTVKTFVNANGPDQVNVLANLGSVSIVGFGTGPNGQNSGVGVTLGGGQGIQDVTSGIKATVSVRNVGTLKIDDGANNKTRENVTVNESTISATGLFGNNAVKVDYSGINRLLFVTGEQAETYTLAPSSSNAQLPNHIEIDSHSQQGLTVGVTLFANSGLNLTMDNAEFFDAPQASLTVTAIGATFDQSQGFESVVFAGGSTSNLTYPGPVTVTNISSHIHLPPPHHR